MRRTYTPHPPHPPRRTRPVGQSSSPTPHTQMMQARMRPSSTARPRDARALSRFTPTHDIAPHWMKSRQRQMGRRSKPVKVEDTPDEAVHRILTPAAPEAPVAEVLKRRTDTDDDDEEDRDCPRNLISRRRPAGNDDVPSLPPALQQVKHLFQHAEIAKHRLQMRVTLSEYPTDKREKEKARTEIDIDIELAPFHVHRGPNRSA
ncbi:hypothetical protein DFH09DRAFT_1317059 [Mycena vulgaris]|nr:hypothetical protein DFH09DRAFT_1317059 [Mycena vulgaris]